MKIRWPLVRRSTHEKALRQLNDAAELCGKQQERLDKIDFIKLRTEYNQSIAAKTDAETKRLREAKRLARLKQK